MYMCARVAFYYEISYAVFLYLCNHVHFKENYMGKRLVLFPASRPLHLLKLNYVICLAVHIVTVLSENMLTQSCRQLLTQCAASPPFPRGCA